MCEIPQSLFWMNQSQFEHNRKDKTQTNYLAEQQPVRDVLRQHEPRHQVVDRPRLPTVGPQDKRVEASPPGVKGQDC